MATSKRQRRNTNRAPEIKATGGSVRPATPLDTEAPEQMPESATVAEQTTSPGGPEAPAPNIGPTDVMPAEQAGPAGAAEVPPPADAPANDIAAERTPPNYIGTRAGMNARRVGIIGAVGLLLIVIGILADRLLAPTAPAAPAPAQQATAAAPAGQAPIVQAPTVQANPTPAPAAAVAPQPGETIASGATCNPIAGLPIYPNATCIEQDTDNDDGAIKNENTYTANASANDVGRFYESAFAQNGWTLQAFEYDATLGQRSVKIEVETRQGASGPFTRIKLTEKGAPAVASTTCNPIAGLPIYPNATCVEFDSDQDDGVIKNENTYTLSASTEDVRRFYESGLTQNGWAGQEFQYDVTQGTRRLTIEVNAQPEQSGAGTRFKIAEQ